MRFILSLTFIITFIISGFSQEGVNPFDIESRLDSVYQSDNGQESSSINVFDVVREDDKIITSSELQAINNTKEESSIVPEVGEIDIKSLMEAEETQDVELVNPFDVSHIPIRKSKLKKEADAFKPSKKIKGTGLTKGSNAFLFWLILLTGFILAIVINTQRGAITKITKAIVNENVLKLNHREEKKGVNGHYILLYFSFIVNASIFIYLILYHMYDQSGWPIFQLCFFAILLIYVAKHIFLSIVGSTFPIQKEVSLYGFTIQSFNLFLGIILIPLNLIIAFGPENIAGSLIYLTIGIIGVILFIRSFRGLLIGSRWISSNLFHFFLYLCAFEILPTLLLIKVIGNFELA